MKDYLIIVEALGGFNSKTKLSERLIGKTEEYANGMLAGLKLGFPKNEVYMTEIKN